jgi:hypothetical protein
MHEYGERYQAGPSQDETGEYVIEEAYPDPRGEEQEQEQGFRPVPLRAEGGEEYLDSHALAGEGTVEPVYAEEYARQELQVDTPSSYVDASVEKDVTGQDASADGGNDDRTESQPLTATSSTSASGRRRTQSSRTASSRTIPTELERALQTFAVPDPRQDHDDSTHPTRIGTPTSEAAGPSRSTQLFPQVVPQKRKARHHVSPESTRTPAPERLALGRNSSVPQLNGTTLTPRRATTPPFLEEMRRTKISRMFAATTGPGGSRIPEQQMSFSTITLLHGHIVQKSYLKEKRLVRRRSLA